MSDIEIPRRQFARPIRIGAVGGGVALAATFLGGCFVPAQFFPAYLYAFIFWLAIALGSLGLLMLHHLTGGGWGFVIRRILEAAAMTLPVLALLFVPLLFGLRYLYSWTDAAAVAADPVLLHRSGMFTVPWFIGRAVIYFACWITLAILFRRWSLQQDQTADAALTRKFQSTCGPGLVVFVFTVSQAAIEWIMSLEPHWYSTVFGMLIIVGQGLAALAAAILVALLLANRQLFQITVEEFHDLGGLLLAFVALWLYLDYAQYIIIWSGDLPHETSFYRHRRDGGWNPLGFCILLFHFAVPFVLLLFGGVKRNRKLLGAVALLIIIAHMVDTYWTIMPSFHPSGFTLNWFDLAAPIGVGGVWCAVFLLGLRSRPLVPLHDPRLEALQAQQELGRVKEALDRG